MKKHAARPRAWLIDIEGVLVRDKRYRPVPGSVDWLNGLVRSGTPFCLVSNNTTHRPEELIAQLAAVGYQLEVRHLVGALELAVQWLQQRGRRRLLWLGVSHLEDFWRDHGFSLETAGPCDAVVLGANPDLEIADLDAALDPVLEQGADVVCLHRNLFFLDAAGGRRLGPGAWAAALEALDGRGNIVTVGKPAERIYHEGLKRVGVEASEALFISDDPVADLVTAGRLGMQTAFVLSGKYDDHSVLGRMDQEDWPDIVCACPADLVFQDDPTSSEGDL
jgi:HAD superfamily hydrolase (TIGR01450 family)